MTRQKRRKMVRLKKRKVPKRKRRKVQKLRRRRMVLLCCPLLLLGYLALPLSTSLAWLVPPRVVTALGAWLAYPSANVLVTEFVHPTVRGSLGSFTSLIMSLLAMLILLNMTR